MKWLIFILQLLPTILQAVKAVEEALPLATGADKKALVMAAAADSPATTDETSMLSKLVDTVVTSLNKAGTLKQS